MSPDELRDRLRPVLACAGEGVRNARSRHDVENKEVSRLLEDFDRHTVIFNLNFLNNQPFSRPSAPLQGRLDPARRLGCRHIGIDQGVVRVDVAELELHDLNPDFSYG